MTPLLLECLNIRNASRTFLMTMSAPQSAWMYPKITRSSKSVPMRKCRSCTGRSCSTLNNALFFQYPQGILAGSKARQPGCNLRWKLACFLRWLPLRCAALQARNSFLFLSKKCSVAGCLCARCCFCAVTSTLWSAGCTASRIGSQSSSHSKASAIQSTPIKWHCSSHQRSPDTCRFGPCRFLIQWQMRL